MKLISHHLASEHLRPGSKELRLVSYLRMAFALFVLVAGVYLFLHGPAEQLPVLFLMGLLFTPMSR